MRQPLTDAVIAEALVKQARKHGLDPMSMLEPSRKDKRVEVAAVWASRNAANLEDLRAVARGFRVDWRSLIEPVLEMAQLFWLTPQREARTELVFSAAAPWPYAEVPA